MRTYFLLFITIVSYQLSFAQADKNFQLRAYDASKYSENVSLFVKADKTSLLKYLNKNGGIYKYNSNDYCAVTIKNSQVRDLLSQPFVTGSDFALHRPVTLNDTMRVRDNVNPVHNGGSPLDTSYTGKGVLIGFIDTGVDFNHPDFKDANGKTRIIKYWDQSLGFDAQHTPSFYGYGQVWDSTEINAGSCPLIDVGNGHGTTVTGTAAGNGLANGRHKGVAPEATIVMVTSDFNAPNWLGTVADATDYIFKLGDSLGMPVVINASIGDYFGSHDGTDPAALFIDSLIAAKPGRLFVCAAGNSGNIGSYHLRHDINPDTTFTWFTYNPSSFLGYGSVFFEGYADTLDLQNAYYAIGANLPSGSFEERGRTSFINILSHVGTVYSEQIINNGNVIADVDIYAEKQGDVYLLQVHIAEPDSNTYNFSFMTTGTGAIDIWSSAIFGTSNIKKTGLPSSSVLPEIVYYEKPDSSKIIVSSFSCGKNTLLVGNYNAMQVYTDYNTNTQNLGGTNGQISVNSSRGPARDNRIKPEISASGDVHMSPGPLDMIANLIISEPFKVAEGGMHIRNGGTSMASPVVAGIGALALQKCPTLTSDEFRNMMTGTAKTDAFTGTVPNMSYGYGKADAFAALVESNFTPGVALATSLCPGDSVELQIGPGPLYNYLWSTGDTTSTIWATDSAYFSVSVTNQYGCKGRLDSIQTSVYTVSSVQITPDSITGNLISSAAASYQWYFDGSLIPGATSQQYNVNIYGNGFYEVYIIDPNGCSASASILVSFAGIEELTENPVTFYPNPATDIVTISSEKGMINTIKIMDASGKLVYQEQTINKNQVIVSLKEFSRGIYFVEVETEEGKMVKKILKEE